MRNASGRATFVAVLVFAAVVVQGAAGGTTTISGPSPFAACPDTLPGNVRNAEVEPWLVVSPVHTGVVAAWQQDRWGDPNQGGAHGLVAWSSRSHGLSWAPFTTCSGGSAATNGNYDRASDVWLSWGPDDALYQVSLGFDWDTGDNGITVSRSDDHGITWGTPKVVDRSKRTSFTKGDDKESITADPYRPGTVYVVWDRYSATSPAYSDGHGQNSNKGPAFFSKSTDGGRTWSDPAVIFGRDNGTLANQLLVLPNGTLVDFFVDFVTTNVKGGVSWSQSLREIRSSDGGRTWSASTTVSPMSPNGAFDPATGEYIRGGDYLFDVAVDTGTGALYAVWQDAMFGDGVDQVAFSRSLDGGLTWSMPVRVSRSSRPEAAYRQAFCPSVDVSSNHAVGITYYDFRLSPAGGDLVDYWGATSGDGGVGWGGDTRLTTSSFPAWRAPDAGGLMIGDYEGLAHLDGLFLAAFEVTNDDPLNPTDIQLAQFG